MPLQLGEMVAAAVGGDSYCHTGGIYDARDNTTHRVVSETGKLDFIIQDNDGAFNELDEARV